MVLAGLGPWAGCQCSRPLTDRLSSQLGQSLAQPELEHWPGTKVGKQAA